MWTNITLADLAGNWLDRCDEYRPSAFWQWNSDMSPERMRRVVSEAADAGIRELVLYPTHGLEVDYLSERYFDRARLALELIRQYDLRAWIYDEFAWPSGNAGGLLLRRYPEHRGWYLDISRDSTGRITAEPRQCDRLLETSVGSPWCGRETGYVDTLSQPAMRAFINMTHECFRSHVNGLLEEVVVGFFTDEPATMIGARNGDACLWNTVGLPWTPALPERFKNSFGYSIEDRYVELVGASPQLRRDYYKLVKQMHMEAYHDQMAGWCHHHGLKYAGHLGEDRLLQQVRFAGSAYQALSRMDEPGIDFLGLNDMPHLRHIGPVTVASIARHTGKSRVYCEAYGVSPLDLRLSRMFQQGQMLGLDGINDIALMAIHQNLDGVRKHAYWPPMFMEAPWWPYYAQYRDGIARSFGLSSLGCRHARYAIVYPQDMLEQTDVFVKVYDQDVSTRTTSQLADAIYATGDTFEYVFPEILNQARVQDGQIVFPYAMYDFLLAPEELGYPLEQAALNRLTQAGGAVLRQSVSAITEHIRRTPPSWHAWLKLQHDGRPGDLCVFQIDYPDGHVVALRNVASHSLQAQIRSDRRLSFWNVLDGSVHPLPGTWQVNLEPQETCYLSVTEKPVVATRQNGKSLTEPAHDHEPLNALWRILSDNTARLSNLEFRSASGHWHPAVDPSFLRDQKPRCHIGLPEVLAQTQVCGSSISARGEFKCRTLPEKLNLIYEKSHLEAIRVNDIVVDLSAAHPALLWDYSCVSVDIRSLCQIGANNINLELLYAPWEFQIQTDSFFHRRLMPSADVFLAGDFVLQDGQIARNEKISRQFPLSFGQAGWAEYYGTMTLSADINLGADLARHIRGLVFELESQDAAELLVDGHARGVRIVGPYHFPLPELAPGRHTLTLKISGTSANLFGSPVPWGVKNAKWIIARQC